MFELAEEALDLIALAVDRRVDGALDLTITLGGDMGLSASGSDQVEDGLGVVAAVSDERACRRQAVDELGDRRLVRCLSSGQHDPERQAVLVHQGVDLGAQSSTRTADGVIRAPLFPPAACWWARMMELSIKCSDCGEVAASASKTFSQTPAFAHLL